MARNISLAASRAASGLSSHAEMASDAVNVSVLPWYCISTLIGILALMPGAGSFGE